jgi:TRAP-type C4-dicarboxylate transport system permease small subunit
MNRSRRVTRTLEKLEDGTLVTLVGALVVVASSQIALRNLFSVTFFWADPLVRHLVLWSGFVGAIVATRESRHIRIDFMLRFCSMRLRNGIQLAANLSSAAVCLVLFVTAVRFILDEREFGYRGVFDTPVWYLQLVFPATFGIMAVRFLAHVASCVRERRVD